MSTQQHPLFGKRFQAFFLRAWLLAVLCFGGGLYAHSQGYEVLAWVLVWGFVISAVGTLIYLRYCLFNVSCPACGSATQTTKDDSQRRWVARCKKCDITWDLNIGTQVHY